MRNRCGSMTGIVAISIALSVGACGSVTSSDAGFDPGLDAPADRVADVLPDALPDVPLAEVTGDLPPDVADVPPEAIDPGPESVDLSVGGYGVKVDRVALTVTLMRGTTPLLALDHGAVQLGRVDEIDDTVNYDPWPIQAQASGYDPPYGFAWLDVTTMAIGAHDDHHATVRLFYGTAKAATLTIDVVAAGRVRLFVKPDEGGDPVAYVRIRPVVDATEAFYGLGGYLDQVNHRGKIRAMQLEAIGGLESGYNEAHVPVPFVIGTRGPGPRRRTGWNSTCSGPTGRST